MVASASLGLLEAAATPTCAPDSKLQNSSWTVYNPPPKVLVSSADPLRSFLERCASNSACKVPSERLISFYCYTARSGNCQF